MQGAHDNPLHTYIKTNKKNKKTMKKKLYLEPEMEIVKMDALTFFAASGIMGDSDIPGDDGDTGSQDTDTGTPGWYDNF